MTNRFALSAGIPAAALMALGMAGSAQAVPAKRRVSPDHAEIEALKAQIAALTARLDAQDAVARAAAANAASAQAAAFAAQAQASTATAAVDAQAKTLPAQIVQQVAASQPKPAWYADTVVSGRMYFNMSRIDQQSNGVDTAARGYGFNIKRFYLGVDHRFDNIFSANVTMDASNVIGQTASGNFIPPTGTANGTTTITINNEALVGRGFYIKKAYLQAKLNPALVIRLGAADLPWVPYVEGVYGYRHVENEIIDRIGLGTSSDWGVHVSGDLIGGLLSYQVSLVDGAGYRNVKVTRSMDIEGRLSLNYKGFFAAVGGYTGKLGNDVQNSRTYNTAERANALIGFKNKRFTVGAEYYRSRDYNNNGVNYINTDVDDIGEGISLFGSVQLAPQWSVFGRYDHVEPRKHGAPNLAENYVNMGVQYSPAKIVDLALTYKRDRAKGGVIATQNGTIGGAVSGAYDEFGLFGQFRF